MGVMKMAFSKGKRIEDETSKRIVDLAVNIGCREGVDALTVTRLCRELNCDRRVIYNRFRDIDEINLIVAGRCNEELMAKAEAVMNPQLSFYDNLIALLGAALAYIYDRKAHFQHYTTLYQVTNEGVQNEFLHMLTDLVEKGKTTGDVSPQTDSCKAAQNIWIIVTAISGMLAANANYQYQDGLDTMLYGVEAVLSYMRS